MHLNSADKNPATPAPTRVHGITWIGSAAANGIAPSVMKEHPMIRLDIYELRSAAVNFLGKKRHAKAIPTGGTIPPTMMEAIAI